MPIVNVGDGAGQQAAAERPASGEALRLAA
jgi:hypothetical protein